MNNGQLHTNEFNTTIQAQVDSLNTLPLQKSESLATPVVDTVQQDYEKRLLNLLIDKIQKTGKIHYFELQEWLNQIFEVEQAAKHTVLLPKTIEVLKETLATIKGEVDEAAHQLRLTIQELEFTLEIPNKLSSQTNELTTQIHQDTLNLIQPIESLMNIANDYVSAPKLVDLSADEFDQSAEEDDRVTVRWLINSLNYIRQYMIEHTQFELIKSEYALAPNKSSYFRRLYNYLEDCSGLGSDLKINPPGNKFPG
jgi:serine phosphatase RsbU (regulator of sigma subunit)